MEAVPKVTRRARRIDRKAACRATHQGTRPSLVGELNRVHKISMAIRESTQAQAPRVLQKSRTALLAVAGLSKQEGANYRNAASTCLP